MKNKILIILFLLPNISFSQQCGNVLLFSNIKENEAFEQNIQAYLKLHQATQREEITIPVVFHVLWHDIEENVSDERILSQLEVLNKDYNAQNEDNKNVPAEFKSLIGNTVIHFCLAVIYPNPAFENVTILFDNAIQELCNIFIINELGVILKDEAVFINQEIQLENLNLPKGVYIIKVNDSVGKFVKY